MSTFLNGRRLFRGENNVYRWRRRPRAIRNGNVTENKQNDIIPNRGLRI